MTVVLCTKGWLSTLCVYTDNMSTDSEKQVDGQSKLERALTAVQAGDLDNARRQFEELAMDDPHDPLTLYNLGLCYNEAGNYEAARKTLLSCLALDPGEANTYVALGMAEAKLGQMADAETHLAKALTLQPDNPYALRNLASVHAATARLSLALEELRRVDTILHDDPPTKTQLQRFVFPNGTSFSGESFGTSALPACLLLNQKTFHIKTKLAPRVGLEPTTPGLTVQCYHR